MDETYQANTEAAVCSDHRPEDLALGYRSTGPGRDPAQQPGPAGNQTAHSAAAAGPATGSGGAWRGAARRAAASWWPL